jgi:PAS domain S-box-containing protein
MMATDSPRTNGSSATPQQVRPSQEGPRLRYQILREPAKTGDEQATFGKKRPPQQLFETAGYGILIVEPETGCIRDVNPFLIRMLGFTHGELVGQPVWELPPFTDIVSSQPGFAEFRRLGHFSCERLLLKARDHRAIPVDFVSSVHRMGGSEVMSWNVREIMGREQAEEKISALTTELEEHAAEHGLLEAKFIEAQKAEVLGQLAGGVAHDFNNILAVIMGYNDFVMANLSPDSLLRKYTEEIQHAAQRAAGLTRQLLIFSRKQTVQPIALNLNDVVADAERMLGRLIGENIEMAVVPGKLTRCVRADPGYIGQVLMNLVVNARDAMPDGGKVTLATNEVTLDETYAQAHPGVIPGDYGMLSVTDTGTGMTEEVKAHLFEPFFTTKSKDKGTGLGLPTCQTIIRESGGHIAVQSEVGRGTVFRVYFPLCDAPLEIPVRQTLSGVLPRGHEVLLVVEDDPAVLNLTSSVLEKQGYNVLRANNGREGLHVARDLKGLIRLVITDVVMPIMGGKRMMDGLKTLFPDLKVLVTSGYIDDLITQEGVIGPGVAFLAKPYSTAVLAHKVREMLDAR